MKWLEGLVPWVKRKQPNGAGGQPGPKGLWVVWSPKSEGATTVAVHLSELMAQSGETGYLDLNLRRPGGAKIVVPEEWARESNLDRMWPLLEVNTLTPEHLRSLCWQRKGAKGPAYLAGTGQREAAGERAPQHIENLLAVARRTFANVVVDVGADLDNPGTVAALREAEVVVKVVRGTYQSLDHARAVRDLAGRIRGVDLQKHVVLLTATSPHDPYTESDVARELALPVVGSLPAVPEIDRAVAAGEAVWRYAGGREGRQYRAVLEQLTDHSREGGATP